MRDEHGQFMDELVLTLLAEEARERECALRAEIMAHEGHESAADAMLRISLRHGMEAVSLRSELAMLHFQDTAPVENEMNGHASDPRFEEQAAMTVDDLCQRLPGLSFGAVVILTKAQFEQLFTQATDWKGNRRAAIELAEANGCRIMFREGREPYAVFTRRQRLSEVVSFPRVRAVA